MKPSTNYDFSVSVRCQTWEEEPEVAELYQGIFEVILNHTLSIMFVPDVGINIDNLPPMLPENVDNIFTEIQARQITIALSKYSITPNPLLAGQEKVFSHNDTLSSQTGVIFFITTEEFQAFSSELLTLAQEIPSVYSSKRVSQIKDLKFSQFLLSRVIESKNFDDKDLQLVGRKKVYF
ncbi:MAG: hypothetical protein KME64_27505 [Scytonematopsis contorta HA4267-MV1]|jgi:hypothetical protein|nr:hypothetical protein [Scytonematopsis contorta HA4267-MV1]